MNLEMSLQNKAFRALSLVVVDCSHHFNPRNSSKQLPLEGVLHI